MSQLSLLTACARCGHPAPPSGQGRERKFCSETCARAEWRERERSGRYGACSEQGCERGVRAKGLCSTHYNQQHQPDRHRKATVPCTWCGRGCQRAVSSRYLGRFCSDRCRDDWRIEEQSWSTPVPWRRCPGRGCGILWFRRGNSARYCPECVESENYPDTRSPLRRAIEDGNHAGVIAAIRRDCDITAADCWNWSRKQSKDGYPVVKSGRRTVQVHRLALEARLSRPLGDQAAHHTCANSLCVNPDHLQPVTAAANMAEMLARTYMVRRIRALEEALATVEPEHALLQEIGIDEMAA